MFDIVYENMQRATTTTMQMQQQMFKRWLDLWTTLPSTPPSWSDQFQQFQKKWTETVEELLKQQQDSLEKQFQAGLKGIENAFQAAESSNVEELRKKSLELWKKNFECLRLAFETQLKDSQATITKWTELMSKGVA